MTNPIGRWGKKGKRLMRNSPTSRVGLFQVFWSRWPKGQPWLMQTGRRRCRILPEANFPNKVPCGSSLACCRRITVAATPYSPRAAASGRPLRITFCSTSGRRPSRAQASCGYSPRLGGNWVALICPATSNHRQAHADLEPGVSGP